MLKTIDAALPSVREPSFATPEEAINFAKMIDRARRKNDDASYIGRLVEAAHWRGDTLRLNLDNGKVLHFQAARDAVDLTIEDDVLDQAPGGSETPDLVLVRLAGKEIHWQIGELIRALVGQVVLRIQASQIGFFLYLTNVGILYLSVLIDRHSGCPFLFWDLSD